MRAMCIGLVFMRFTASLAKSDAVTPLILTHFSREAVTALIVGPMRFRSKNPIRPHQSSGVEKRAHATARRSCVLTDARFSAPGRCRGEYTKSESQSGTPKGGNYLLS